MAKLNPTAIYYPYYHSGICFQDAKELAEHLEKEAAPDAPPAKPGRKRGASADASNAKELAEGLAGTDSDDLTGEGE
jgi:hypothetical protein